MKIVRSSAYFMIMTCAASISILCAQNNPNVCANTAVAAGTYSVTCDGWTAVPGGSLLPIKQVGIAFADASSNWSGFTTINIGGQVIIEKAAAT